MTLTRTRRAAVLGVGGLALALVGAAAGPATANQTLVTFTVDSSGGLNVSVPTEVALGQGTGGASVRQSLGAVTVTDTRNSTAASWTATVSTTDAVIEGGSASIPKSNIVYTTGTPSKTSGALALAPASLEPLPVPLATDLPIVVTAGASSSGSQVRWTPTLEVRVPAGTPAGTYAMRVTHSVN